MQADVPARFGRELTGREGFELDRRERRRDLIHEEAGAEQHDAGHGEQHALVPPHPDEHPALGERAEREDREQRHDRDEHAVPDALHADQQQLGVEQEDQRQHRGSDVVEKGLHAGLEGVGPRYCRGRERGKTDRRRRIREEPVVQDIEVDGDERQDEAGGTAELDQYSAQQRRGRRDSSRSSAVPCRGRLHSTAVNPSSR